MSTADDLYCITVQRFGALDIEETAGELRMHAIDSHDVEQIAAAVLMDVLATLCPGDRAQITLTRGPQIGDTTHWLRQRRDFLENT